MNSIEVVELQGSAGEARRQVAYILTENAVGCERGFWQVYWSLLHMPKAERSLPPALQRMVAHNARREQAMVERTARRYGREALEGCELRPVWITDSGVANYASLADGMDHERRSCDGWAWYRRAQDGTLQYVRDFLQIPRNERPPVWQTWSEEILAQPMPWCPRCQSYHHESARHIGELPRTGAFVAVPVRITLEGEDSVSIDIELDELTLSTIRKIARLLGEARGNADYAPTITVTRLK
jgi:hypothetical protein